MLLRSQALWLQTRAPPLPCQRQLAKEELQFELVRTPTSPVRIPLGLTGNTEALQLPGDGLDSKL